MKNRFKEGDYNPQQMYFEAPQHLPPAPQASPYGGQGYGSYAYQNMPAAPGPQQPKRKPNYVKAALGLGGAAMGIGAALGAIEGLSRRRAAAQRISSYAATLGDAKAQAGHKLKIQQKIPGYGGAAVRGAVRGIFRPGKNIATLFRRHVGDINKI